MKCIFIYNPNSGKGKIAKKLPYIRQRLKEKYEVVDVYATKARGDLTDKVKVVADEYDCIIFSGGDGTFNEVLQGVADREDLPLLGYIPSGTMNDVAHSVGIPRKSIKKALNVILEGEAQLLDCMKLSGGNYAMYSVSAGAFTGASYTTPQNKKRALGAIAYGLEGLKKELSFLVFPVKVQTETTRIEENSVFILVMNGRCVAGMKINSHGSMKDGKLECAVVKQRENPNFFHRAKAFFGVLGLFVFGYRPKAKRKVAFSGERLSIEVPNDVVWNFDGEKGTQGNLEIEVLKNKVPLLVPKKYKKI